MVPVDRRYAASRRRIGGQARSFDRGDVRAVRSPGNRDLLPQLLGEYGGSSADFRLALRVVSAHATLVAFVFRSHNIGRGCFAIHFRHLDGAELRRFRDDQHLDGRRLARFRDLAAVLPEPAAGVDFADHRSILHRGDKDSVAANQGDQPRPAASGRGIFGRAAGTRRRSLDGEIVCARGRRGAPVPSAHDRDVRPDYRERETLVDPSDVHRVHLARCAANRDLGGRADDHARQNDHRNRGRVLRSSARALLAAATVLRIVGHRGDGSGSHRADIRVLRRDTRGARCSWCVSAQSKERTGTARACALWLQAARRRIAVRHSRRREPC